MFNFIYYRYNKGAEHLQKEQQKMKVIKRKKYIVDGDYNDWGILEEYDNGIIFRYRESFYSIELIAKKKKGEITEEERKAIDSIAESKGFKKCKGLFGVFYSLDKFKDTPRSFEEIKDFVNNGGIKAINATISHCDNADDHYHLDADNEEDKALCIEVLNNIKDGDYKFTSNKADFVCMLIKNVNLWNEIAKRHYYTEKIGSTEITIGHDIDPSLWCVALHISFPICEELYKDLIHKAYEEKERNGILDEADANGKKYEVVNYSYTQIMFGVV